ncbi:hypothetical protein QG37_01259 [Candidozyma auris]|nr:hypothetical protein QG37_01259 [[Candida] auris]
MEESVEHFKLKHFEEGRFHSQHSIFPSPFVSLSYLVAFAHQPFCLLLVRVAQFAPKRKATLAGRKDQTKIKQHSRHSQKDEPSLANFHHVTFALPNIIKIVVLPLPDSALGTRSDFGHVTRRAPKKGSERALLMRAPRSIPYARIQETDKGITGAGLTISSHKYHTSSLKV